MRHSATWAYARAVARESPQRSTIQASSDVAPSDRQPSVRWSSPMDRTKIPASRAMRREDAAACSMAVSVSTVPASSIDGERSPDYGSVRKVTIVKVRWAMRQPSGVWTSSSS